MKYLTYLLFGIYFGIVLVKSEVLSWFRIEEMFWFQSFHMYGVIMLGVAIGAISVQLIKRLNIKTLNGEEINLKPKPFEWKAHLIGGTIFGLGWALTGACPGPLYALVGSGYLIILVPLLSAVLGAYAYGAMRSKLPH